MRWNIVGTMWVWLTRWSSISASASDASQDSITTTPTPKANGMASEKASGAAWYSGPVHRWTSPRSAS